MARPPRLPFPLDPFLLCLIAVVGGASLFPARGVAETGASIMAGLAISLLFFLHGAKLSRASILQGAGNWRLHLLVLGSTYVLFPAIGLTLATLLRGWEGALLLSGLLYLTLLPSTVQSSIAFTAMAGGNVAAAVCSASLSNVLGIAVTPLLVGLFMHMQAGPPLSSWHSVQAITLQLLAPFLAGHMLRPLIGGFIDSHKGLLMPVDRGSILLVVYSAFSAAVVNGIWSRVTPTDLIMLLAFSLVILLLVMVINALAARLAGLSRADTIVLLFCGSKKSLVSGVPMAGALFPAAQVGMVILPLMIFHQLQLFLCAALAGRFVRAADGHVPARPALPLDDHEIGEAASDKGLSIPGACMPGVRTNLALLDRHAAILLAPAP